MRTLDSSLIPTHLVERSEFRSVPVVPLDKPNRLWLFLTLGKLLTWFLGILWLRIRGKLSTEEFSVRLRIYLEEMGGLWIKAGQLLSLRRDIFPPIFCEELAKLLDHTTGFPFEVTRKIIEEDLGGPLEDFFAEFAEEPFAAASIGQTYRARLRVEDVWVAVKVQRPGVRLNFRRQFIAIRLIAGLIEGAARRPDFRLGEMVAELEHIMTEELDYRMEASNIRRMRKSLRKHNIYIPKAFGQLCAPRVLVMEFIQGVLMSDYISVERSDPQRTNAWLRANGVTPKIVGRRLYHSLLRQIFEDNLFHGDMHPGNIILLRNNRVALVDFGSIGFMETDYQKKYQLLLQSLALTEYSKAIDVLFMLASTMPPVDVQEVKEVCIRILRAWEVRTMTKGLPYHQKSLSTMYQQLLMVLNKYKVRSTWLFLKIDRAALTLDASLAHLIPDANFPKLMRSYFRTMETRQLMKTAATQASGRALAGALSVMSNIPELVYEYRMFQAPLLRRHAVNYEGSMSKIDKLFAVFFDQLSLIYLAAGGFLLLVFLHQYFPRFIDPLVGSWLARIGDAMPRLSVYIWLVILFLIYNTRRQFTGLKKRFEQKEARLPEP
jgi:ubiquinone biosynthesis protein